MRGCGALPGAAEGALLRVRLREPHGVCRQQPRAQSRACPCQPLPLALRTLYAHPIATLRCVTVAPELGEKTLVHSQTTLLKIMHKLGDTV